MDLLVATALKGRSTKKFIDDYIADKIDIPEGRREIFGLRAITALQNRGAGLDELDRLIGNVKHAEVTGAAQTMGLYSASIRSLNTTAAISAIGGIKSAKQLGDKAIEKQIRDLYKELESTTKQQAKTVAQISSVLRPKAVIAEGEIDVSKITKARRINEAADKGIETANPQGYATSKEVAKFLRDTDQGDLAREVVNTQKRVDTLNKKMAKSGVKHKMEFYYDPDGRPMMFLDTTEIIESPADLVKDLGKFMKLANIDRVTKELDNLNKANKQTQIASKAETKLARESSRKAEIKAEIDQLGKQAQARIELDGDPKALKRELKVINKEYGNWEKAIHIYRNNLLSAPQTGVLATGSAAVNSFGLRIIERGFELWDEVRTKHLDRILGERGAFRKNGDLRGMNYIPRRTRQLVNESLAATSDPNAEVFLGPKDFLKTAPKDYARRLLKGDLPTSGASFRDRRTVMFNNRFNQAFNNTGFLQVSYLDATFRSMAENDELVQTLYAKALNHTGNRESALRYMPFMAANRDKFLTNDDYRRIRQFGQAAVFANDNNIAKAMEKGWGPAVDLIMPFRRAPTNVVFKMFGRSPIAGLMFNWAKHRRMLSKTDNPLERAYIRRGFNREAGWQFGSIPLATAGWWAYDQGLIDLEYAGNQNEVKLDEAQSRSPFSLKLGPIRIPGRYLYPASFPLFQGAIFARSIEDGFAKDDVASIFETLGLSTLHSARLALEDIPSLQGIESISKILGITGRGDEQEQTKTGADALVEYGLNTATGFIPWSSFMGNIAKATTPNKPQMFYEDYLMMAKSKFFSRIPGLRATLPEKFEKLTGKPLPRNAGNEWWSPLVAVFMGGAITHERNVGNPYLNKLSELYDADAPPGKSYGISPTYRSANEYPGLSEKEVLEINQQVAYETASEFIEVMNRPGFADMSIKEQHAELDRARGGVAEVIWAEHADKRRTYDPDAPPKATKPSRAAIAYRDDLQYGYGNEDLWTPMDHITYKREQIENGELDSKGRIQAEEDIIKYQVQAEWYEVGQKDVYTTYHDFHSSKRQLLKHFSRIGDEASQRLLYQMAMYENQLNDTGIWSTRAFTNKDGSMKSFSEIFGSVYEKLTGKSGSSDILKVLKRLIARTKPSVRLRLHRPKV